MDKERRINVFLNKIQFCIKTGRHKKELYLLKKELAKLS